jgi:hypothetical protein
MSRKNRPTTLLNRKNNPSGNLAEKNHSKLIDFSRFQCYIDPVAEINNLRGNRNLEAKTFDLKILQHKKGPSQQPTTPLTALTNEEHFVPCICRIHGAFLRCIRWCVVVDVLGCAIRNAPLFFEGYF